MNIKKEDTKKEKSYNLGTPKNFLIPLTLLHLQNLNAHGYELMEKLTQFGIQTMDQGNFYRVLRQLEKDGLVTSIWDTSSGGPAKRIYSITEGGEQYLEVWADSLGHYQKMLNQFFNLYNPFYNPFTMPSNETKEKNEKD
ncbi:poly-beta-hydroxybutyrate-responsive repressor [Sporosarcina sp. P13]|uniref:poly-beta-hydroxybutyrate-responsive repressor n=1 Tax=Sporosarcina sp. P13 TaxID=2048263 RepID=UPI000C1659F8|nr:poly-beta-hydroxybutyrate-responsive repressor [Sporosarcina sp. P13]PIC63037.1 poly-beta-hydroxybutyrate-responsive repressor [Sporosarcina sp. P13]